MLDSNSTAIKHWLSLSLAGFSLGTILGGVTQQNWQKALMTGAVGVPIACVSSLLVNPQKQSSPSSANSRSIPSDPVSSSPISTNQNYSLNSKATQSRAAIFWDYENIHLSDSSQMVELSQKIVNLAEQKGHLLQKYVYSDWKNASKKVTQPLTSHGFNAIHVSMGKPNSVDVRLAVDCISAAYQHPEIKYVVLVTSDKDYISLINKLQELQREVVLIGNDQTSKAMQKSADHFFALSAMLPSNSSEKGVPSLEPSPPEPKLMSFEEGIQCLLTVLQKKTKSDESKFTISQLNVMMRDDPKSPYQNFSSVSRPNQQKPFSKFSEFIQAVEATGKITTFQQGQNTYASLANKVPLGLTFEEAKQCVLYALVIDHQQNQREQPQEVNIAHLTRLVKQHLEFNIFTLTKIQIQRQDGQGRYRALSKFLDDVAKTQMISVHRDDKSIHIKLLDISHGVTPPESLLKRLSKVQAEVATEIS